MTHEPSAATAKRLAWAVTFCNAFRCVPSTRTAVLAPDPVHHGEGQSDTDLAVLCESALPGSRP